MTKPAVGGVFATRRARGERSSIASVPTAAGPYFAGNQAAAGTTESSPASKASTSPSEGAC